MDLGPTGVAVADNIKRVRAQAGLSLRELADKLADNGHPIAHSGLSKIENKTRRVDADDLMAIAVALGVSPVALLLPAPPDPRGEVRVTGSGERRAIDVWQWVIDGKARVDSESRVDSLPWWLRVASRFALEGMHPASAELEVGRRKGRITETVRITLDEDDPRVPFLVHGETLDQELPEILPGIDAEGGHDGIDPEAR